MNRWRDAYTGSLFLCRELEFRLANTALLSVTFCDPNWFLNDYHFLVVVAKEQKEALLDTDTLLSLFTIPLFSGSFSGDSARHKHTLTTKNKNENETHTHTVGVTVNTIRRGIGVASEAIDLTVIIIIPSSSSSWWFRSLIIIIDLMPDGAGIPDELSGVFATYVCQMLRHHTTGSIQTKRQTWVRNSVWGER